MRKLVLLVLLFAAVARADTLVSIEGGATGEVCRFHAGSGDPFQRWLTADEVTCVPSRTTMAFPPGLWNVFARTANGVSTAATLVDAASPPPTLTFSLEPAATLNVQLPPGSTGTLYAPKRIAAFPVAARMVVPAAQELWLFVTARSVPVSVIIIPPTAASGERTVDATHSAPAVVGWIKLTEPDRAALKTAHGATAPSISLKSSGREAQASTLPALESLDGALLLFPGVFEPKAELRLEGRGWLPFRRSITLDHGKPVTLVRAPLEARPSSFLIVNWSTASDLPALDRSLGACGPVEEPPPFELTISSCAAPPSGEPADTATCQPIRKERLSPADDFGSVTVGEVPPGSYRAELRFGKVPPVSASTYLFPLQAQPLRVQAWYFTSYGSLTRGGQPLHEDARITFPLDGTGFIAREEDTYHAVLKEPFPTDAKIDVITCRGERVEVLADRQMLRTGGRFDIDIPDNQLTINVVDTFTHLPVQTATVRYTVMSIRLPRRPVLQSTLKYTATDTDPAVAFAEGNRAAGQITKRGVPPLHDVSLEVSSPGYKKRTLDLFSMTKSEKKEIEVQLVPVGGAQARIVSQHPFEKGSISWFSATGVETERADLADDGTFFFERTHYRGETMVIMSASHPLWIIPAPIVERAKPLQLRFPDNAPVRDIEVSIPNSPPRVVTLLGVSVGGLRIPTPAFIEHLSLHNAQPFVRGAGPAVIPAVAETGPIDVVRGPATMPFPIMSLEAIVQRGFGVVATKRLEPGGGAVVFDSK